ncbi:class I SAM-dependent methyltransferase [Oxalobacteraceae bacterium]|nr:class I SAM-dependent methyltransferase [Oxalobacteraceae bacterium]
MTAESKQTGAVLHSGLPSRSALTVALLRAAHQLLDTPLVFSDPLALPILGAGQRAALLADPARFDAGLARPVRTAVVMRSRLAEDELALAMARGVRQYVVLGAGLDTYACRQRQGALRVFEVDHPATQDWKDGLLRQAGIGLPSNATLVPLDFEQGSLRAALERAGCRLDQPVFFSWLGVTLYLSVEAIFDTLEFVASLAPGSAIVFDYGVALDLLGPVERMAMEALIAQFAAEGEPWKTLFAPGVLAAELRTCGFSDLIDSGPQQLQQRYLAQRADRLQAGGGSRIMLARV